MATLSLKISLEGGKVVKTIQFDPSTSVYDACRIIREKILEANANDPKEYGLFLASEEDNKKGIWLEASRSLDYYMLRNGDLLEYNKKTRNLRVRMLDGTVKTLLVDDSQIVANLMVVICTKIGITNYDEYGLVREDQKEEADPCEKPNYGTLTLKRRHQEKERDTKMDQLRKKLRTDDEVNWVEPSKTLREQGVEATETLLLRRRLFFSDRNVDSRDPVQLNLLYVQARDAILAGTHPITQDKACEFAGIQCQIQFGDHKEDKHTTGFLDLKEFLPASYVKVKGIEKKVFKEHRKHAGLSELDAKVLYTKSARDLKTYGVAFFLVKEKMKGKNKLVPRLLGVTKDSVLRLDEKTKEILQTWPLTTVRRWCASPNTFTLDFGDYSDQYYSVQTTEAEQILQVIAGYIDIIVRKRRARDHLGIEGDEGSAMLEDSVSPSKANIIQHDTLKASGKVNTTSVAKPAVLRPGAEGAKPFAVGHVTGAQQTTVSGQVLTGHAPPAATQVQQTKVTSVLTEPQRALLSTITSGKEIIKQTEEGLTRTALPALGHDAGSVKWMRATMDSSKQVVTSHIAAMNAATAQVVTLTAGPTEEVDHTAVGAAITTITTNLPEMTKGVQMIAALMDDTQNGDRLLDATRKLCSAFSDLLKAAEPDTKEPRQNLLNAASRIGEASTSVLHTIGEETEEDKETQVFFGKNNQEYGADFAEHTNRYEDDGIYEDIDTSNYLGKMLDIIDEETDSEYYRSVEYCNKVFKRQFNDADELNNVIMENQVKKNASETVDSSNNDYEAILFNCEGYLEKDKNVVDKSIAENRNLDKDSDVSDANPKLYPKTISDKIFNFKKDFSNHDYVNVNFKKDFSNHDYVNVNFDRQNLADNPKNNSNTDINLDRRTKNEILRQQFFQSGSNKNDVNDKFNRYADKNDLNDKFNRLNDKKIECHSIRNDITKTGPDVKVSGALNMKLFNLDKYNRILTTTETFMETSEASFTKNELNLKRDDFETFIKRSEKYFTTEHRERETTVHLNNASSTTPKGKTEIRIVYNPTFLATQENIQGFCQFCNKRCPRTDLKCCQNCDILLSLAKAVANTTAALVLKAKNVASQCKDEQPLQNNIIAAATHCALATSQLVACAKVVAPTLHNPACREQLTSAARQVAQAVEKLVAACNQAPESAAQGVEQLTIAAQRVSEELERLLAHCDLDRRVQPTVMEQSVESVMCASERVADAPDAPEMVRRARLLGQATARLIADIKTEAEKQPSEAQRKLLAAAKLLADATARMVEAARLCASQPQDRDKQEALRRAAEELRFITVDYAQGQDIVGTQLARLSESARQAASSATQLVTSAHNATQYNTNKYSQETLLSECEVLNEQIPRMAQAARTAQARPADPAANLDLITASETFLQPSGHVVQAARGVLPTVNDITAAKQLADTTHQFTTSCADLRSAVSRARVSCKGVELDAAAEIIRSLQAELDEVEQAARDLELRPLPGQTAEWASTRLQSARRSAASATAQLVSSARRRESPGCSRAAVDLASALRDFAPPLRATVATAPQQYQTRVIKSGRQVLYSSLTLVETVKHQLANSEEPDTSRIMSLAKNISEGMEEAIGAVPSYAELDAAIENIGHTLDILDMGEFPHTDRTYGELQTELNSAAVVLSNASSHVVNSVDTDKLPSSAADFQASFERLVAVCLEMAGHAEETESRMQMVSSLKTVTVNSSKLLSTAKSVSQDLTRPNAKNQLAAAARAVTESINHLVDVCTEAAPGQKECAAAIRNMESSRPLLSAPTQPISELGYFACLDAVVDQSKLLSEGMSGMASAVKKSETDKFSRSVATVATAVQGLVECTAQAAYLVAVSDETSVAGRAGLVDQAQFARAAAAIDHACRTLCDPNTDQHQVLSAATVVAKHTSALCNACRGASGRCAEPQSKRHFVQAAKDVANCTAALVKEIKALDADYCDANRAKCAAATTPLQEAVRSLRQFADSPEFAAVPAKISPQARDNQEAILHCGRNIITESCSMVEAARALALSGTERAHWHALAHHSKAVSDTIKSLVTNIREKAPGQRECAAALETLNKQLREMDQISLQAVGQELQPRQANTLQGYSEQMENSAAEMVERLEPLRVAARSEAENLGHAVVHLISYAEPLVTGAAGAASNMTDSQAQAGLLQHTRTVLETLSLLLHAAKQAAGNPRATAAHGEVDAQTSLARSALSELSAHVRELSTQRGAVGPMLESVARAVARLTEHRMSLIGSYDETDSFVDYQTRMVGAAKEIARLATDMTAKAATEPTRLVEVGNEMCGKYERLAADSVGASATTPNGDIANRIRLAVVELGEAVSALVRAGGHCRLSAIAQNQKAVADSARKVNEKVVSVLSALQAGSRGTQACIDAAATIATILGDLDTTILFASAGTLQSDKEGDTFSNHRENILKTAKTLVEDTKTLVGGAAGSQEQLAAAAQSAVSTIVQLCEVVKQGATSLSGAEPQVLVLHAARDAAAALRDLAAATAAASGKSVAHPDMHALKHAAKRLSDPKRWSLPIKTNTVPRSKRRSINIRDYNSCDSETDMFQSDQEDELIKLLDYSSHDDDVSPTIFHDSCEELIAYIESKMIKPPARFTNDDVNTRYNLASRNSLFDMDWRVVKYGENIFLSELKKLVDLFISCTDKDENRKRRHAQEKVKASSDLDSEMTRLSQVMDDLDWQDVVNENIKTTITTTVIEKTPKRTKFEKPKLKSPVFKVKKVKPINLVVNLEAKSSDTNEVLKSPPQEPKKEVIPLKRDVTPPKDDKSVTTNVEINKMEFWNMFKDDTVWWKALAKRNLEKMEETRRELERFSGHELVLGEIRSEMDKYEKEKETLQSFIEEVDKSKDLEYDKKYEDMVLKLIEFAKKDFIYKGFDPLIEKLKLLSNIQIEGRKKRVVNIEDILNVYTQIDISKYTYEELCLLEKYYQEIIRKYKIESREKENLAPVEYIDREKDNRSAPPSYHRNVILNLNSQQNLTKNVNHYSTMNISNSHSLRRTKNINRKSQNNVEIFDLTRTYPMQYYANNWWSIYEDILKNREEQFGTIDNWWNFYEDILNRKDISDEELRRIRAVVEHRMKRSRPNSRLEEQLKMLDEVKNARFQESEDVATSGNESVMVTNVTSLLKTVKAVEDEHTRGTRALESTIEAISQEIEVLMSPATPKSTASVEELMRCTRLMTAATARAVAASGQDQLTAAANLGRRTVLDMLAAAKGAAHSAETEELKIRTLETTRAAAEAYRSLLAALLNAPASRNQLPELSRRVAQAVADMLAVAELLKGSEWVDPADPTVIAEQELLGAAASIDAAARKLDALRPRVVKTQETDENMNFDEMILEAAKSIIAATSALVRAASAAQRELIDQGKVARRPTSSSDDGQWSEGLVSAARLVAAAAHALVEAANALVQGAASEERLISSARQVASSTAQLLVACKVKADPSSESTRRLQSAGAEVIRSTDNLVRAARDAIHCDDERSLVLNRRMVGGIAQEIDARSEVLRIEKELEEARGRLTAIRQAKYKLRDTSGASGDETDTDHPGYSSDASHTPTPHRFKPPTSSFANTTYSPNSTFNTTHNTHTTHSTTQNISNISQSIHGPPTSPGYNQNMSQSIHGPPTSPGYNQNGYSRDEKIQSPSFSSFRPLDETPKQNYEGFTTRTSSSMEETVVVKSLQLPAVRTAYLVTDEGERERIWYRRQRPPPPPPRRISLLKHEDDASSYETRLYDTPRPTNEFYTQSSKTDEQRHFESSNQFYKEQKYGYDAPKVPPMSPKFNARDLKFDETPEPIYSTLKKPFDGVGQTFTEHKKSTEAIPGGTKQSEFTIKSESYQSYPKTEFFKTETRQETKSPFATSTPAKSQTVDYSKTAKTDFMDYSKTAKTDFVDYAKNAKTDFVDYSKNMDMVKAVTPEYERISSPYGKDVHSFGGPNFFEETTTEVKEIPNGTQKITKTTIYSSSPVNLTTTNTKYEPIKLEGIDELSKFDNDSRYSTLDSRFNTLESKLSSDTSRSFMRPSDFQTSDYQATTSVTKVKKPSDLVKEIDSMDKRFSTKSVTSEIIEKKSVMTSSHKSESSSTVTKKFGNL
ncbi:talin-1 [Maniola hyperantus]|uniref:talin-1 n=1 Tax=Aphantopus hyperantus TaxID=2795564 RepID=UPI0037497A5F